jgi:SAM-dependent methyltransferase
LSEVVWQDVECGAYTADLPLWHELVQACEADPCDVLDLGCGTGRVSLALAGPSCRVTAIDTDRELVEALSERAARRRLPVVAVVADVRSFDVGRKFDLILAPMQLVQLLQRSEDRAAMLSCVARHLEPGGRVALALLDLEEEWSSAPSSAPIPDMLESDGWVYSSQPIAVRRVRSRAAVVLERVRQAVSPSGEVAATRSTISLELLDPSQLERQAEGVGLQVEPRRTISPTDDHVGSTVVMLRARETADG